MNRILPILLLLVFSAAAHAADTPKFETLSADLQALMKHQLYSEAGAKECALLVFKRLWDPSTENVKVTSCMKTNQGWDVKVWHSSDLVGGGCLIKLGSSGNLRSAEYLQGQ